MTAYRRIIRVDIGDAIDDRTGEVQVVLIVKTLEEDGHQSQHHFCLPPEAALSLGKSLLSGETTDRH